MPSPESFTRHHVTNKPTSIREVLRSHFALKDEEAKEMIGLGAVYLNKERVVEDSDLAKGAYLRICLKPHRYPVKDIDWKKTILEETADFYVVRKPFGIPVHPMMDNISENVLHQLRLATGDSVFVTQRLDVPVGGLLLFAKTQKFQTRFNNWLQERRVKKIYKSLTRVAPATGLQVHFMMPSERSPRVVQAEEKPGWQRCELTIHKVEPFQEFFESTIELHTGRTHQIRAQLSALGAPIIGDRMYGGKGTPLVGNAIGLFSHQLSFPKDGGGEFVFSANPEWVIKPKQ